MNIRIPADTPELGFKAGLRVNQPVCLEDIMPTVLALAGASISAYADGVDLGPTLRGKKQTIREWLHFEHAPCYSRDQAYHALIDGTHKYIWRPAAGREHLFDLKKIIRKNEIYRRTNPTGSVKSFMKRYEKKRSVNDYGRRLRTTKGIFLIVARNRRP